MADILTGLPFVSPEGKTLPQGQRCMSEKCSVGRRYAPGNTDKDGKSL